jgi:hypothetical protein
MNCEFAERARALVGTRFRPQGRSAEGMDCVGVVIATFGIDAGCVRRDYRLRGGDVDELDAAMLKHFRRVPRRELAAGDVLLLTEGNRQLHLAVRTRDGFVHAHAGLRRVVETSGLPEPRILRIYRRRVRARER